MKRIQYLAIILLAITLSACSAMKSPLGRDMQPVTKILKYTDINYDKVFLLSYEAVSKLPGWEPDSTRFRQGKLRIRNTEYSRFGDADKRVINLLIQEGKPGDPRIFVSIAKEDQKVLGAMKILDAVDRYIRENS